MGMWGSDDGSVEVPEVMGPSSNPIEKMVMRMIATNPALGKAMEGVQTMLQKFADQGDRIEAQNARIIEQNDLILARLAVLNRPQSPLDKISGEGVISDGEKCPNCGSTQECDCYASTDGGSPVTSGNDG